MQQRYPVCMFCRHYQFQGRRGGTCQLFNAPVCGQWTACSQMSPASVKVPVKYDTFSIPVYSQIEPATVELAS